MVGTEGTLGSGPRCYLDHVGRGSFYGLLASLRGSACCSGTPTSGRVPTTARTTAGTRVPPSLLATALLTPVPLRRSPDDRVSDAEAKARADFDLRWKVASAAILGD